MVRSLSDDPDRLVAGVELSTDSPDYPTLTIAAAQQHKDGLLVGFADISDRGTAEGLRGVSLLIKPTDRRQLGPDEFWPDQLIGMRVVDPAGADLGTVVDVIEGSAQDRLKVDGPTGIFEVPFVSALVPKVDITGGLVVIDPLEGLVG